jgi:hypothetical protein
MPPFYGVFRAMENNSFIVGITRYGPTSGGLELFHYFSIFIVVGASFYIDLKLLGLAGSEQTLRQLADRAFPAIWIGMVFNALSGFIMYAGTATEYYANGWMYTKIAATVGCLLSVVIIQRNVPNWDLPKAPTIAKLIALVSIVLWISTILLGVEVPALTGVG